MTAAGTIRKGRYEKEENSLFYFSASSFSLSWAGSISSLRERREREREKRGGERGREKITGNKN